MDDFKISIAMTTFNGARFLEDQLLSLASQTRLPDEVVICDDVSTDDTENIVAQFSQSSPLTINFSKNSERLGVSRNFQKAINKCSGDLILLSDQDDFWFSHKVSTIERLFIENPTVMVSLNDQEIAEEDLRPTGITTFGNSRGLGLGIIYSYGCCTAIRRCFLDFVLPFPPEPIAFDGWIHRVASALGVQSVIEDSLQFFRRHEFNNSASVVSQPKQTDLFTSFVEYRYANPVASWLNEINASVELVHRLHKHSDLVKKMGLYSRSMSQCDYERRRIKALYERLCISKVSRVLRSILILNFYIKGKYEFFHGWKSAVKDLIR